VSHRLQDPPTFMINDKSGCIGRFYWMNTIQFPGGEWFPELFPIWGFVQWFKT